MKPFSKLQNSPLLIPAFRYSTFSMPTFGRACTKLCFGIRYSIFILISLSFSLYAQQQQWTEPINISNLGEYLNKDADMVIDQNGVLHVVWSMRIKLFHEKIMYSYSINDGDTWSIPLDLLKNKDLWMSQPHIASDNKNNLYVTYDYATGTPDKMIYLIVYNGQRWGEPMLVSEGLPGSDYNKILIDNDDKVFVFWGYQEVNIKYRIYQNNSFGKICDPYFNALSDAYYVYFSAIDINNHFHWIGYTTEGMPPGTYAHAYFLFNPVCNEWNTPHNLSSGQGQIGNGIDLLCDQNPVVTIREDTTNWPTPYNDITFVLEKDSFNWSFPETLVNIEGDQKLQRIAVDQHNDIHIIEMDEIRPDEYSMIHYQKRDSLIESIIIGSKSAPFKLLFSKNKLYLVHGIQGNDGEWSSDIFIRKYDIITNIKEEVVQTPELKIYPNPSQGDVCIEFENNEFQDINLSVSDMTGKHIFTLINEIKPPGVYRQIWKVTDKYRKENAPQLYLVRLQSGRNSTTQVVEIIR